MGFRADEGVQGVPERAAEEGQEQRCAEASLGCEDADEQAAKDQVAEEVEVVCVQGQGGDRAPELAVPEVNDRAPLTPSVPAFTVFK